MPVIVELEWLNSKRAHALKMTWWDTTFWVMSVFACGNLSFSVLKIPINLVDKCSCH